MDKDHTNQPGLLALRNMKVSDNVISVLIDTHIFQKEDGIIFPYAGSNFSMERQAQKHKNRGVRNHGPVSSLFIKPVFISKKKMYFYNSSSQESTLLVKKILTSNNIK